MNYNKEKRNQALRVIKYLVGTLFIVLVINLLYFNIYKKNDVIVNPYNPRLSNLEETIIRGNILDSKGEILAYTEVDDNGNEKRIYPYNEVFAHVVGYTNHGKTGIEDIYNLELLYTKLTIFDEIKYSMLKNKKQGNTIVTTLDLELQQLAHELIGDRKGAIVALEPSTGKVLVMISKPDLNPNNISIEWENLSNDNKNAPLINRATQGLYPPGSIYKIITSIEYLNQMVENIFEHECTGKIEFNDESINCYNNTPHGKVDLKKAFALSCNTTFAKIGSELDLKLFYQTNEAFLFNKELPYILPYSKSSFSLNEDASISEIIETSIGQGKTLITPLHAAILTSTIANGGIMMEPYLVDRIENYNHRLVKKNLPIVYKELIDTKTTKTITEYMIEATENGTGRLSKIDGISIASKTGSAENPFGEAHAWYVGFAPADNPQIAIAIIVENSGVSSINAAPIAKRIFAKYLAIEITN